MSEPVKKPTLPPYLIVKSIDLFRRFLLRLNRSLFPGGVVLYEQFQNLWVLPSLYVAAELDIAEKLRNGALSASAIAEQCHANPEAVFRLMRALSSEGIFKYNKDGSFQLNGRSRPLLNGPGSVRHMLMHHLGPVNWSVLGDLLHTVRTGEPAFKHIYKSDMYDYLSSRPDAYELFDKSMSNLSELGLAPLLSAYSFDKFRVIADIGGGEGFLLANLIALNPKSEGILFDLPEAIDKAPPVLQRYGTGERIRVQTGDFLAHVPVVADLYILKNILHNWNDPESVTILRNIASSMPADAKLIILEMIVPEDSGPSIAKLLDIQMMASFSKGKERTRKEFEEIINDSGLVLTRVIPTIAPIAVLEVIKMPDL